MPGAGFQADESARIIDKLCRADGPIPLTNERYRTEGRFDMRSHPGHETDLAEKTPILGFQKSTVEDRAVVVDIDIDRPRTEDFQPPPVGPELIVGTTTMPLGAKAHRGANVLLGGQPSFFEPLEGITVVKIDARIEKRRSWLESDGS